MRIKLGKGLQLAFLSIIAIVLAQPSYAAAPSSGLGCEPPQDYVNSINFLCNNTRSALARAASNGVSCSNGNAFWDTAQVETIDRSNGTKTLRCVMITCTGAKSSISSVNFWGPQCETPPTESGDGPQAGNKSNKGKNSLGCKGSIIQVDNHVLGEMIPVVDAPFELSYFTNRTWGRIADYSLEVPLTADSVAGLSSIQVEIKNSLGQVVKNTNFTPVPNLTDIFTWDGLNSLGQPALGTEKFDVKVTINSDMGSNFTVSSVYLGNFKAKNIGLGGWVPSIYHYYDVKSQVIYRGDGSTRPVVGKTLPTGNIQVAEEDGSVVYEFKSTGEHLNTRLALTGAVIYTFNYNSQNKLASITEPGNLITSFNYNGNGQFISIASPHNKVTSTVVDTNGNLTLVTNPIGDRHVMQYLDAQGLLTSFKNPTNLLSEFTYDVEGNLLIDRNSGCALSELSSPDLGNPSTHTLTTKLGRVVKVENAAVGDTQSRTVTYPSGLKTLLTESPNSLKYNDGFVDYNTEWVDDPRFGNQSRFIISESGDPTGAARTTNYNQQIVLQNNSDPFSIQSMSHVLQTGFNVLNVLYDGTIKTFQITTGMGRASQIKINELQNPVEIRQGLLDPVQITYTSENQVSKISQSTREQNFNYTNGLLTSFTNSIGQTTSYEYDGANRLVAQTLPDLRIIRFTYDGSGHITSVTPPTRPAHLFGYGSNDLLASYTAPSLLTLPNTTTQYTYNPDQQLTKITHPDNSFVEYSYGTTSDLVTGVHTSNGDYSQIEYDISGRLISIRTPNNVLDQMTYQAATLKLQTSQINQVNATIGYEKFYDPVTGLLISDRAQINSQNYDISYTYDRDEYLTQAGVMSLNYTLPTGLLTKSQMQSTAEDYLYNSLGEFTNINVTNQNASPIYNLSVERDSLGRIVAKHEGLIKTKKLNGHGYLCSDSDYQDDFSSDGDDAQDLKNSDFKRHKHRNDKKLQTTKYRYIYDSAGRLAQVIRKKAVLTKYTYDDNNNRIAVYRKGKRTTATYDAQDRLLTYGIDRYEYTPRGDLKFKINSLTKEKTEYTYDVFGNLLSVKLPYKNKLIKNNKNHANQGTTLISYIVDSQNRRVARLVDGTLTNLYVYNDLNQIIADINSSGSVRRYIYATKPNIPDFYTQDGKNYKIISDQIGSVRAVIDTQTNDVIYKMSHDEFGRVLRDSNPGYLPFGFAGGLYDHATGLVRFGARDYDPEVGRWTAKDPILFEGGDANLYGYILSDPINGIDSDGLDARVDAGGGGGVAIDLGPSLGAGVSAAIGAGIGACMSSEHKKNKRPSTEEKHQRGRARENRDQGGEKGDLNRRWPSKRPKWYPPKGPYPPKNISYDGK